MKHPHHILLLSGWYYPDSVGGTEAYVRLLGKELQTLGWDVMVAAPSADEKEYNYIHDGLSVYRYPISLKPSRPEVRGEIEPKYFDVFANWLEKNKPDIIHFHSRTRGCSLYHIALSKKLGIPSVLTVHAADFMCVGGTARFWGIHPCDGLLRIGRCTSCWLKRLGAPWLVAWFLSKTPVYIANKAKKIENKFGTALSLKKAFINRRGRDKLLFNSIDHIVVVSDWLYRVLLVNRIPADKISICKHGLSSELVENRMKRDFKIPNPLRIGFIGRFNYVKGAHVLIKAIKRLPLDTRVELRLYGRVNMKEEEIYLKWLKKISKNESRIIFCDEITDKNRQEVLNNLDVIAVPSIWLETGPLVILEAFAAGVPVMGNNLGGITELVKNGVDGILVETGNIKAWSDSIRWIYEHPGSLKYLANNIPPVRNVRDVAEDMISIYEKVLTLNKN